jgi:hypothetical protein
MTAEKVPFGKEWTQKQLEIEEAKIQARIPLSEQIRIYTEALKTRIEEMKAEHLTPPPKKHKPTKEERRTNKECFTQIWELEGSRGIHNTMNIGRPPRIEAPVPQAKYPIQEDKDWRKLHPRKTGWGPYHNLTRQEWSEKFEQIWKNRLPELSKWVDQHPNDPEAEYYKRTILKK